jgi:galactose mutarotase-like enzyme
MGETTQEFDEYEIGAGANRFLIAPDRGGLVTELWLDNESILYLDRETFNDPSKSVRGGIPILFPMCGPLRDDRYEYGGQELSMKQHGFARTLPWSVTGHDASSITIGLGTDHDTRAIFPFDFTLRYTYKIRPGTLRIDQFIENRSPRTMPFSCGFHPYFATPDKSALRFDIPAHQAAENPFGEPKAFSGFDFDADAIDLTFTDAREPRASFDDYRREQSITVSASVEYHYIVFWTLKDRPFVCLEPWTARGDALNTHERLIELRPSETRHLWMEITRKAIDVV